MPISAKAISAPTLQRLQELKADGLSLRQIASRLQFESIPPPAGRKGWNHVVVDQCLAHLPDPPPPAPEPAPPPTVEIDVHGPYTAADRRLWGVLLHLVGPEWDKAGGHKLSVSSVLDTAGLDREQLGAALDRLTRTGMKWVGHAAPGLTVRAALLASSTLSGDRLSLHFAPHLLKLLQNAKQQARIHAVLEEKAGQAAR